jgi:hypothetical protein
MSVKIAFWGMDKSFHTTEIMAVMACLLAKSRPACNVLVQRENGWQCIFSGGKEKILLADCGYGRDKKTQNSLKKADIIVAGMQSYPSEWEDMIRNFVRKQKKVLYLIEGYAFYARQMKNDMVHTYRIAPEQIGYIPQNGELEWVSQQGKMDNFIRLWKQKSETERNKIFFEEMGSNLFLLRKQIEKIENGGFYYGTGNETLRKCNSCSNRITGIGSDHCGSTFVGWVCCDRI